MKRFLIPGLLALACLSFCSGAEADTTIVNSYAELRDAVKNPVSLDIRLGSDIAITSAIRVSLDAKIDGAGKKLTAGGAFRHFEVQSAAGNGPTFKGVTFEGGGNGGGVSVASGGKATFEGGTFRNNRSTGNGGALSVSGAVTLSGTVAFDHNTAADSGGAVYLDGADVEFPAGVRFENNTAKNGGAVALSGSSGSRATFNGNAFSANRATENGGALHIPGSAAVVFNADQEFGGNSAADGGAIWTASLAFASGRTLTFTGNTATGKGGALYVEGTATLTDKFVFRTNGAAQGGAVFAASDLTVAGGSFAGNTASESGGAICAAGTAMVTGGAFEAGNKAEGTGPDDGGGAIWAKEIKVEPSGSDPIVFAGQVARKDGGALFSKTSLSAKNTLFTDNKAMTGSGGAVMANSGVTLEHTAFRDNSAAGRGGAVFAGDSSGIASSLFQRNASQGDGGAFILDKTTATFQMSATLMEGNTAGGIARSGQGGALFLKLKKAEIGRSTFAGNLSQSPNEAQGGAVRISAAELSDISNGTFAGNSTKGDAKSLGGALFLDGPFTVRNCTLALENATTGAGECRGGGIFLNNGNLTLAGSIVVGNKSDFGADIYRGGGIISTGGYNRIARFGVQGAGAGDTSWAPPSVNGDTETDRQQEGWTSATFFGSNGLADNSGPTVGTGSASGTLRTIALNEADALAADSRAMDAIPSHLPSFPAEDERGVARPQPTNGKKDIGAVEEKQGGGNDPGADPSLTIKSVRMSGIPNTLTRVGQTATLTATVVYANGTTSSSEKVTWSSSNPGVARIDAFGNLYARSMGRTVISVAVNRQKTVADSADLTVREEMSYTNVHPEIWKMLGEFNDLLSAQGAGLTIADSDPARVKASAFQKAFRDAWGTSAVQVTELKSRTAIRFKTGQLPSAQGWSTSRPTIDVSLGERRKGDLLPLRYRWSLSWDELSTLMGRKVTKVEPQELLDVLKPAFISAGGEAYTVVGTDGAAASQAISSGALKVTNGNNGATLELTAFVADATGPAASPAKTGPRIVEGLLVVPDGVADGTISGAMGLLQKARSGGGNKGEGGGGGCDAGVSGMMLALVVAFLLRRKA